MHPGMFYRWKRARAEAARHGCGPGAWGPQEQHHQHWSEEDVSDHSDGQLFGVRRPLRFMAHKLELDEDQIAKLAGILAELKTERAQASVDHQRTIGGFAAAIESEVFDTAKAEEGLKRRVESAERLRTEVLKALSKTHAMLRPDQRARLAYLLRSGQLTI
jgi:Spy/CpxP family protein refolding chaperone